MRIQELLNKLEFFFIYCGLILISSLSNANKNDEASLLLKGYVFEGSCMFKLPEQIVKFPGVLSTEDVSGSVDGENKLNFTVAVDCINFIDMNEIYINLRAGRDSRFENNKLTSIENKTNAGFLISECGKSSIDCSLIDFSNNSMNVVLPISGEYNEKYFEVSVAKLNSSKVNAGKLIATLEMNILQP